MNDKNEDWIGWILFAAFILTWILAVIFCEPSPPPKREPLSFDDLIAFKLIFG